MAESKIGVYLCHCGSNIADKVDMDAAREYASGLPGVVVSRDYKYMCSEPGQDLIKSDIQEHGLDRVVVASCSPRMHEPTFKRACETAGLNPYLMEMANIREQCSWVTPEPAVATAKGIRQEGPPGLLATVPGPFRQLFEGEVASEVPTGSSP